MSFQADALLSSTLGIQGPSDGLLEVSTQQL